MNRGIFKIAEDFDFKPVPKHNLYDPEMAKSLKEEHEQYIKSKPHARVSNPEEITQGGESLVLHGDGTLDYLDIHHAEHFNRLSQLVQAGSDNEGLKNKLALSTWQYPTYQLIHELFDGGIRIYMLGSGMYIATYRVPSDRQFEMLKKLGEANNVSNYEMTLNYQGANGGVKYKEFSGTLGEIKQKMQNIGKIPEEKQRDIELLRQFRSQEEPTKLEIPRRNRSTRQISPELAKQIADSMKPFQYREVGAKIKELVKIAQNLDEQKRYYDADCVLEYIESLSSS